MREHAARLTRYGLVGALGFVVDSGMLSIALRLGLGLYFGRLVSYLVATTSTWLLHRRFTFGTKARTSVGEWLRFVIANGVGGLCNLVCYALLVATTVWFRSHPVAAVAIGASVALTVNYVLNLKLVFGAGLVRDDNPV